MKSLIYLSFSLLLLINSSCNYQKQNKVSVKTPVRFDQEWEAIKKADTKIAEAKAVNHMINVIYDQKRTDSTGFTYGLYHSYINAAGERRPLSELYNDKRKDSLKTIIIEIAPASGHQILERQSYQGWKPKDLTNLIYFMDR